MRRLLICVCGASAAANLPAYLVKMRETVDCHIRVVMTYTAEDFLPPALLAQIVDELITSRGCDSRVNHVELAQTADVRIVLPASAHLLSLVAQGAAPSLVSSVLLAAPPGTYYLPSMNHVMWGRPSTARNVAQIRADGDIVVEPEWSRSYQLSNRTFTRHPTLPSASNVAALVVAALRESVTSGPGQFAEAGPSMPTAQRSHGVSV